MEDLDAGEALADLFVLIQQNAGAAAAVIQDDLLKSIIKFQQAQVTGKGAQEAWNELIAKATAVEKRYGADTTAISDALAIMTRKILENIEALKLQADTLDVVQGKADQFNAPRFLNPRRRAGRGQPDVEPARRGGQGGARGSRGSRQGSGARRGAGDRETPSGKPSGRPRKPPNNCPRRSPTRPRLPSMRPPGCSACRRPPTPPRSMLS